MMGTAEKLSFRRGKAAVIIAIVEVMKQFLESFYQIVSTLLQGRHNNMKVLNLYI